MSSQNNTTPIVSDDTLHLNDVETFPSTFQSTVFEPGDLMISLRNINGLAVFDPDTLQIKFISAGRFTRQHDPDFMEGDRISVFDNRNFTMDSDILGEPPASRVVEIDVLTGEATPALDATNAEESFFTAIMGVHQRLNGGNILVTPSGEGRVLEFTADGRLAWRYENRIEEQRNGRITMATVLPETMDEAFFNKARASCDIN
jgi:hypothetical protein